MDSSYFQSEEYFYIQEFGISMGSSLSPAARNIFMEYFENHLFLIETKRPKIWWRNVDIFAMKNDSTEDFNSFVGFINLKEPLINYTIE